MQIEHLTSEFCSLFKFKAERLAFRVWFMKPKPKPLNPLRYPEVTETTQLEHQSFKSARPEPNTAALRSLGF